MAPQPLNKVHSTTSVLFDPKALSERPELALLIARAIAGWSEIEGQMGFVLVRMLGANAEPALAMYGALTSAPAQISAAKAAASSVLDPERLEMVEAVLKVASALSTKRHHLAHRIWGYSEDLKDALILADSKDIARKWMRTFEASRAASAGGQQPSMDWPREKMFVYRANDLLELISELDDLRDYFYQLSFLVEPEDQWHNSILDYLNAKPRIQEALTRIRRS
jgi:hypothetical protein